MSNVLFRCPWEKEVLVDDNDVETVVYKCPSKLFALPGRKGIRCRHHDLDYEQVESLSGPDFLYVDEDGHTKSKDRIDVKVAGQSVGRTADEIRTSPGDAPSIVLSGDLAAARQAYRMMTSEEPDGRWGLQRIQSEIDAHVREHGLVNMNMGTDDAGEPNEQETVEPESESESELDPEVESNVDANSG